jgi:hypothetical protein
MTIYTIESMRAELEALGVEWRQIIERSECHLFNGERIALRRRASRAASRRQPCGNG